MSNKHDTDALLQQMRSAYSQFPEFQTSPGEVQRLASVARTRRNRLAAAGATLTLLLAGGGIVATQLGDSTSTPPPLAKADPVVMDQSRNIELYASSTADDWVQTAQTVALVRVVEEREGAFTQVDDGSGDAVQARSVSLEVVRELWRSPEAGEILALEEGDTIAIEASGWVISEAGSKAPLAIRGQPRLEVGHSYVVALVNADCAYTTSWGILGTHGVIPADTNQLGYGESEGRLVTGDKDQTSPGTLERRVLGQNPDVVTADLKAAAERAAANGPSQDSSC